MKREPIDWKSRHQRQPANGVALARAGSGSQFRLLLLNISYEGCQVLCEQPVTQGETLTVSVRGKGEMPAQVRWVDGDKAGLRFLYDDSAVELRRARLGV